MVTVVPSAHAPAVQLHTVVVPHPSHVVCAAPVSNIASRAMLNPNPSLLVFFRGIRGNRL